MWFCLVALGLAHPNDLMDDAPQLVPELLREDIKIEKFLESEGNRETSSDKSNCVDMMCEDGDGRKIIIEVQYEREYAYFHRMLYGASKAITEYMELGDGYEKVQKVYSISIVYFDLGQGTDYVYRGRTDFHGLHGGELLKLSPKQQEMFGGKQEPGDLMPEYYLLKVNNFNKVAKESLDQWISFLKTGDIPEEFDAQGLPEARERLRVDNLPDKERREYVRELERRMVENDVMNTYYIDGRDEGLKEGRKNREMEIARNMKGKNYPIEDIIDMTGLTAEEIAKL